MRIRKRAPAHPGRIIKNQHLEPLSMTITDLANVLGVSRKTLSKIVNERASITPDMALRLSRAFDTSPDLWLNLQKNYDLWYASNYLDDWKRVQPVKQLDPLTMHVPT
jgi:addiction module HigA family antidote